MAKAPPPEGGDFANLDEVPAIREPLIGVSNGEGLLALKVSAVEDTWLRVVVDGGVRFEFLLEAGKDIVWKGNREFMLSVGNVFGTRVFLNGASVPPAEPFNERAPRVCGDGKISQLSLLHFFLGSRSAGPSAGRSSFLRFPFGRSHVF